MAVVQLLKPTTPGQRFTVKVSTPELHKGKPVKQLVKKKRRTNGRNNQGRITVCHRGGGERRHLRIVDFKRQKDGIRAKVERLEYDPNRSAHLAVLLYVDGERRYILAPKNIKVGQTIYSGAEAPIEVGNCLPIENIPVGSVIHGIEMKPGAGAQLVRSAGGYAQLLAKEGQYATIRLRSGEMRKVLRTCRATIGEVGNAQHSLRVLGKAGAKRWRGIRPTVRGVAMNPVDHPLGGGEGRTSGGRNPCNFKGLLDGKKTRRPKKHSDKLIVRRRRRGSGRKKK